MIRLLLPLLFFSFQAFGQLIPVNRSEKTRAFFPGLKQTGVKKPVTPDDNATRIYTSWADLAEQSREHETPIRLALTIDSSSQRADWASLRRVSHVRYLQLRFATPLTQPLADSLLNQLANWPDLTDLELSSFIPNQKPGQPDTRPINGQVGAQLKSVRRVDVSLSGDGFTSWLQLVSHCPALHQLTINKYDRAPFALPTELTQLKQLRTLLLNGPNGVTNLEQILGGLPALTRLQVSYAGDGHQLTRVLGLVPSLRRLHLSADQPATKLTGLRLNELPQLDTLNLQLPRGATVSMDSILVGLHALKSVDLYGGRLSSLNWLADNPALSQLRLVNCLIDEPGGKSLAKLTRLETVSLESIDSLRHFPEQLTTLPNLNRLIIGSAALTSIPPSIGGMTSLTALSFSRNKLRDVPVEIGRLIALKTLDLSGNQLASIPVTITRLEKLTDLMLAGNQLTSLPVGLGRMRQLHMLSVSRNRLVTLPDDIGQCRELTTLFADVNPLTSLPESIGNIDSLQALYLGQSRLRALPASIGKLNRLRLLTVSGGSMTALPESLGNCRQLRNLSLTDSTLTTLPVSLVRLENMEYLFLSLPQLRLLPPVLTGMNRLRTLSLVVPQLLVLPDDLGNMSNLTTLSVTGSQFIGLPASIGRLRQLRQLTIDGSVEPITRKALGKLEQLPDSIARCEQLGFLTIRNQLGFDGADAIRKTARLANLTSLALDQCGIDRLEAIDWKTVLLRRLSLQQNSLRDVPESILEAPNLESVNLAYNYPLPRALNQNFWTKELLRTAFVEAQLGNGSLPTDKPNARIMQAYLNAAMRQMQQRNWGETFANMEKAILVAPDTLKALPLAQRAELRQFRKEYALAVPDYEQAIALAPNLSKRRNGLNGPATPDQATMVAQWWGRLGTARSALGQYDKALSDLSKALDLLPPGENTPMRANFYTEQAKVNANRNKPADASTSLARANDVYAAMPYAGPGERLTEVELAILTNQPNKATAALNRFRQQFPMEKTPGKTGGLTPGGYQTLHEYLSTCTAVLNGAQTPEQAQISLATYLKATPEKIYNWSFDLFETMLPRLGLPAEKTAALSALTTLTKQQAAKVE